MAWTETDQKQLKRAVALYPTQSQAAAALGISDSSLSRYLDELAIPHGNLAQSALREKILASLPAAKRKAK